jgi:hypothetical protein
MAQTLSPFAVKSLVTKGWTLSRQLPKVGEAEVVSQVAMDNTEPAGSALHCPSLVHAPVAG